MKVTIPIISCILLLLCGSSAWAQPKRLLDNDSLLKIYLQQSRFDVDSGAQAVILYEKGTADFRKYGRERFRVIDYTLEYKVEKIIKVIKSNSLSEADINLPYTSNASLKNIEGITFNIEKGVVVRQPVEAKSILKEKISGDLKQYKFNLAKVKPGSILYYSFTYSIDLDYYKLFSNWNMEWAFHNDLPTLVSEFELIAAPNKLYKEITIIPKNTTFTNKYSESDFNASENSCYSTVFEVNTITETQSYARKLWKLNNLVPAKEEPNVLNIENWIPKIRILVASNNGFNSLPRSWDSANAAYYNTLSYGKLIFSVPNDMKDSVLEHLQQKHTEKLDLAKAIYRRFRDSITYNQYAPTLTAYLASSQKGETAKKKPSNFNLRLTQILRKAGFKAFPVLISTTDNGKINSEYFEPDAINYVLSIVLIDKQYYLLDASSQYLPFGILKPECYNGFAWIISDKGIPINIEPDSLVEKTISIATVIPGERNGIYKMRIEQKLGNVTGPETRKLLFSDSSALKEEIQYNLHTSKHNGRLKNISFLNKDNPDTSLVLIYDLELETDTTNDISYLNPFFRTLFASNPFVGKDRIYPIEYGHTSHFQFVLKFQLPSNCTLEEYDNSVSLKLKSGRMRYQNTMLYNPADRMLSLNSSFITKTATIPAEEYNDLKAFYDRVITEQNKKVVIKKIK